MSYWKAWKDYPPAMVRIYAKVRRSGRWLTPLTDEEIAIGGGLTVARVKEISFFTSWDSVPFGDMEKFVRGCRFDPTDYKDRHRAETYARNANFHFWKKSGMFESHFVPLCRNLVNSKRSPGK